MTPDRCARILKKKVMSQTSFFQDLTYISKLQKKVIENGDYEKLEKLVVKREVILHSLNILKKVIGCYIEFWNKTHDQVMPKLYCSVEQAFVLLVGATESLKKADSELKKTVEIKVEIIKREIQKTRKGVALSSTYLQSKTLSRPRFVSKVVS